MSKIYYLGDSIMAWNPIKEYNKYAVPGYTTLDLYISLSKQKEICGDIVMLLIGINDIISHYSQKISFQEYKKIFSLLQLRFSKIIILSILPTNFVTENKKILEYNQFLYSSSPFFLNLYPAFLDEKKERIAPQYTTDGVHLSHAGYHLFNTLVSEYLKIFL